MKKFANFMYGLIFAFSMFLVALFTVVTIGRYDYKWTQSGELPSINPSYEQLGTTSEGEKTTTSPNENMNAVLTVSSINGELLSTGHYKCTIRLTETVGGVAKLSYIEYALFDGNTCFGVYYNKIEDETLSMLAPLSETVWENSIPYSESNTLLKVRVVWIDEFGEEGETFASINYDWKTE